MTENTERIRKMHNSEGFQNLFDELMKANPYFSKARIYELLEEEHEKLFGERKYSGYASFSVTRSRLIKAKRI